MIVVIVVSSLCLSMHYQEFSYCEEKFHKKLSRFMMDEEQKKSF